jgi:hypothetical protein
MPAALLYGTGASTAIEACNTFPPRVLRGLRRDVRRRPADAGKIDSSSLEEAARSIVVAPAILPAIEPSPQKLRQ